jgi:hypothetical protein
MALEKKGVLNMTRIDLFGNIFSITFGLCAIIFHRKIASMASEFQYKLLHIHFNEAGFRIGFLIVGVLFVIFGIFDILRFMK